MRKGSELYNSQNKAIELFMDIEAAAGEDATITGSAAGAMTSCVELVSDLGGRRNG